MRPETARIYETAAKEYAAEDSTAGDIEYGFDADGSFVFTLPPNTLTPLPWANIMANERFGTMVTERGGGYTWCGNSSQAKLTPWYNDPVRDPMGSFMLIMDKHSGRVCQIEAGPLAPYGADGALRVRIQPVYGRGRRHTHGGMRVYGRYSRRALCADNA